MTSKQEFELWFVTSLDALRTNPHGAFVFAIVAFPLLERYLREKSRIGEGDLNSQFYTQLEVVFPEILGHGRDFYSTFRNGLLHQAAFSLQTTKGRIRALPKAGISGYDQRPVYHDASVDRFYMNPVVFYDRIINVILNDFSTYEGSLSSNHPLPGHLYPSTINPLTTVTIGAPFITGNR